MSTLVVAATAVGRRHADHLAAALPDTRVADGRPDDAIAAAWDDAEALVCCMATGAATRLVAGRLADKHTDPPVVVVDDAARWAVVLLGGHHGGNALAGQVADALGAAAVVTTASEAVGTPALDTLGAELGLTLEPACAADLPAVGSALVAGEPVHRWRAGPWPTGPLPGHVVETHTPQAPGIAVTDELVELPRPMAVYRPASLVVGVGASRGVAPDEVTGLIDTVLAEAKVSPASIAHLATVDAKSDEPGLVEAAAAYGVDLVTHPPERLRAVDVPNPSEAVADAVGTASVAEAAALAGGGELLVPKRTLGGLDDGPAPPLATASEDLEAGSLQGRRRAAGSGGRVPMATAAVARRPVRGRLALVSTGPGDPDLVPAMARRALASADLVVGLDSYVEGVRGWLRPGCEVAASPVGEEVARAETALTAARAGRSVALVSGGDVGVYAMASPTLERAGDDVEVVVVPGTTAAQAAAALLGSPLGHDHATISLSDLLTPWEAIRRRIDAVAEGDFVVCLYNPRSAQRHWQLEEARALLAAHRPADTPVGIVRDAYRPGQEVRRTTLAELDVDTVDMRTVVVIGSSATRIVAGRMVTPRGYA